MTKGSIIKIKESQIKTLIDAGYSVPKATLHFVQDEGDGYFTITFTLSSGVEAQFVGDRDTVRQYKNPAFFLRWAEKNGIEEVTFASIRTSEKPKRARKKPAASATSPAPKS